MCAKIVFHCVVVFFASVAICVAIAVSACCVFLRSSRDDSDISFGDLRNTQQVPFVSLLLWRHRVLTLPAVLSYVLLV